MDRFIQTFALGAFALLVSCAAPPGGIDPVVGGELSDGASETALEGTGGGPRTFVEALGLDRMGRNNTPVLATQPAPPPGVLVPFGEVAIACGLRAGELGQEMERVSGYRLYDTAPGAGQARTLYLTGFDDGCARQVSGTLALFGDVGTHEFLRYGPQSGVSYSATDTAYEEIKGRFCGVASGQPCGDRLDRLSRSTTFITIYQRFGGGGPRLELLLHDRQVVARSVENR